MGSLYILSPPGIQPSVVKGEDFFFLYHVWTRSGEW